MKGRTTAITRLKKSMDRRTFLARLASVGVTDSFPWMVVSTRELAKLLDVPLQTIHNWEIRDKGPEPVTRGIWRGNRRYFRLADVIAWLEDVPTWTVYQDWAQSKFTNLDVDTVERCEKFINELIAKRIYVQPRWKLKRYGQLPLVRLGGT